MSGERPPAPVNLKRLYLTFLAATLTIGTICLVFLLMAEHRLNDLAITVDSGFAWFDGITLRLGEAQSSFHRSISSPAHAGEAALKLERLSEDIGEPGLPLSPSFPTELKTGLQRLEGLFQLAAATRDQGGWEDLQIIMRDADRSTKELFTLLQEERSRLYEQQALKRNAAFITLKMAGFLLVLSLILSVIVSIGLYINWRRFERAVLGMK